MTVLGIQYLRGIAAIFVVLVHANAMMRYPEYFGASPASLKEIGLFGVAIFFVISGFIIAIVSLDKTGTAKLSAGEFVKRRFIRIIPFMWLCIIAYNLLSFAGTGVVEWADAGRAMVLWPVGELKPNVIWTLRHELLFYSLFAVTMLQRRRYPWLLAMWLVAPIVVSALWPGLQDPEQTALHPVVRELLDVVFVGSGSNLQFGAGLLLGALWIRGSRLVRQRLPLGPLLPLSTAIAAAALIEVVSSVLGSGAVRFSVWTLIATLVVWVGLVTRSTSGHMTSFATLLGNASYAVYLVHNAALLILLEASARVPFEVSAYAYLVAFVILATTAGVAVHLLVEAPLLKRLSSRKLRAPVLYSGRAD